MEFVLSFFGSQEFYLEVQKGNVPGHSIVQVQGVQRDVDTGQTIPLTDLKITGQYPYSTSGEQWEIVSTSANDTSAGTGARTLLLTYLDDSYVEQTETLTLNGTTAVTTVATDIFRLVSMAVVSVGSGGQNEGDITLQVAGGGTGKGQIQAQFNNTAHGLYTVPDGFTAYLIWGLGAVQKNKDCRISFLITNGDAGIFYARLPLNLYQDTFTAGPTAPAGPYTQRTEIQPVAQTENNNTEVSALYQLLLVEN